MKNAGQFTIWDEHGDEPPKPCFYRFKRYIGQRVRSRAHRGVIVAIDRFYTTVRGDDGKLYAFTPHDTVPDEKEETRC